MTDTIELVACHECDQLQRIHYPPKNRVVRCCRCNAELYRYHPDAINRTLALAVASLLLFIVANAFPIVAIDMQGNVLATSMLGAIEHLWQTHVAPVSILVALTTLIVPGVTLLTLIYLLTLLQLGRRPPGAAQLLRLLNLSRPWGMIEVYLLGILVSVVKLMAYASVVPGVSLWALVLLIPLMAAMLGSLHFDLIWRRMAQCR
ncbi:paraquat-inducible protein [Jeongeupia sp. HS-3]|uniref:paraquat-inducible protein A n=1 Tax=Jeongeupia sp. HS-3 TaxID=1009682 RepID=UPI0018A3B600|nr:paraquat-inducible protein A [Jeongeupia sp. HS-3]BCL75872.1 paraquat-inducible protein [Jeongeupia sp. HS-3]